MEIIWIGSESWNSPNIEGLMAFSSNKHKCAFSVPGLSKLNYCSSGEVNAWQIFLKKINFVYPETLRIMWLVLIPGTIFSQVFLLILKASLQLRSLKQQ